MSESLQQGDESARITRRPALTLNRRGLTLVFGLVLLCPIAVGTLLQLILPATHDRPLPVLADLISEQGQPQAIRLKNTGEVTFHNLRIELNGAFAYLPQAPLAPNEQLDMPLEWFAKKTGQRLQPAETEVRTIHVSARLPGNERAIFTKPFQAPQ